MNKILMEITTKLFDSIEKDKSKKLSFEKENYGVYYNPEKELINHFYYEHKIFSVNFKEKVIKFISYPSRLTIAQVNYLLKFYEKFNFRKEILK